MSKLVFVQVATEEFGIKGRPTNVSRASILTGISRKEVKRQRDLMDADAAPVKGKTTDATKVLSGWFQDPDYLDADGAPRLLNENGPKPSFATLCTQYGGDIAVPTMLKELIKTKAIKRTGSSELKVLSRYYRPSVRDDENLRFAVERIHDVIETMNNNVFVDESSEPRFGGFADNEAIPVSEIPKFRDYLDKRGQEFLEEIDDWLTAHADTSHSTEADKAKVGISLFATEQRNGKENTK